MGHSSMKSAEGKDEGGLGHNWAIQLFEVTMSVPLNVHLRLVLNHAGLNTLDLRDVIGHVKI